jgi:hypothetical protein
MAAFPRKHEPDFRKSADESRPGICRPPKLAALRAEQYPHRLGSQAERPPRFLNEAMRPWAGGGSPGVPAFGCCRPHVCGLCRKATARRSSRRVTPPSPRLTRNAVQLRKLFYQAGRVAAGLLVVVFAMTGAAKLADQIVTWLTFAVWQPFTIADALRFRASRRRGPRSFSGSRNSPMPSCRGPEFYLLLAGACLFMFARIDRGLGRLSRKSAGAHPQRRFDVIAGTSAVRHTTEAAQK